MIPEETPSDDEARAAALRLLARREHTRRELTDKLGKRGFEPRIIGRVLDGLESDGLLDERRFAESFVRSRLDRGQGPLRIGGELRLRGVDGAVADEVLQQAGDEAGVDWIARAHAARARRFGPDVATDRREAARQARFLEQRGFTAAQVRAALSGAPDDERE